MWEEGVETKRIIHINTSLVPEFMNRSISIKTKLLILIECEENIQKKNTHTRHIFLNATRWRFFRTLPLKAKQAKKNAKQAMKKQFWRIYSPVYLQTNPRHRPEREKTKTKKKRIVNRSRDFPVHRPGGRPTTAVKSGWVNRFHLSDSQPASQQCVLEQNKARRQNKKNMAARARGGRK